MPASPRHYPVKLTQAQRKFLAGIVTASANGYRGQ